MKREQFPHKPLLKACAAVFVAAGVASYMPSLLAATAAGTQIKNTATVTYEDADGNTFTALSDESIVTVAQVYSATLGVDQTSVVAPGQLVALPYTLTNTGNGTDTYTLSAANGYPGAGDSLDSSDIKVFIDSNNNGLVDAGEVEATSVTLTGDGSASDSVDLLVQVAVPATALENDTLGVVLNATSANGIVTDVTTGAVGGVDAADNTNHGLLTVTGDAVLDITKSVTNVDTAANQITYQVTVSNNGNAPATNVIVIDGIPANTTFVSATATGLQLANGDTLPGAAAPIVETTNYDLNANGTFTDTTEAQLGYDLNNDGDTADANVLGVSMIDADLQAGTTILLDITVSFDPATLPGATTILNQAHVSADSDGDNVNDQANSSNITSTLLNGVFGVTITDIGGAASPNVNDGADDDATANDDQLVDSIAAGGNVLYTFVVTNSGNSPDRFELSALVGNFPAGTSFSFGDAAGIPLTNTNGTAGVDTGEIAAGASMTITMVASLPGNVSGAPTDGSSEYQAVVTAASANDPASVSDTANASLTTINAAVVDIHNAPDGLIGSDENPIAAIPYSATSPVDTFVADIGTTLDIPFYVDNESSAQDQYDFASGIAFDGTTLTPMPNGWTVQYFATDVNGNAIGAPISNTGILPAGSVNNTFIATIFIPNDGTLASENFTGDADGNGTPDTLDFNGDGDGDYPFFIQVTSPATGATDITMDGIDVNADRVLTLTPNGVEQVIAGDTATYTNVLENSGSVPESIEVTSANSNVGGGFTHTVQIDTNGDGVADTDLGALVIGSPITVQDSSGATVIVNVTDTDGDSIPELVVAPGVTIPLTTVVVTPNGALPGTTDVVTLTATNVDTNGPSTVATDTTSIIDGQVQLTKQVAIDFTCNGQADTPFETVQTAGIEPGQCAIWELVATNTGTTDALNVRITDAVPAFSAYEAGSMRYCTGATCDPSAPGSIVLTDSDTDGDGGEITGGNIYFYVGTGADGVANTGGVLTPGEVAKGRFSVRVQ